eukprot:scaffold1999_cov119-Isochrysis_galbana.AAC.1
MDNGGENSAVFTVHTPPSHHKPGAEALGNGGDNSALFTPPSHHKPGAEALGNGGDNSAPFTPPSRHQPGAKALDNGGDRIAPRHKHLERVRRRRQLQPRPIQADGPRCPGPRSAPVWACFDQPEGDQVLDRLGERGWGQAVLGGGFGRGGQEGLVLSQDGAERVWRGVLAV